MLSDKNAEIEQQKEAMELQAVQLLLNNQQKDKLFSIIAHEKTSDLKELKRAALPGGRSGERRLMAPAESMDISICLDGSIQNRQVPTHKCTSSAVSRLERRIWIYQPKSQHK